MLQKRILPKKYYHINGIDETEYSQKALQRKSLLEKYLTLKARNVEEKTIFEVLEISRATYFRWNNRYEKLGLIGLEDESKAPNNVRKPKW